MFSVEGRVFSQTQKSENSIKTISLRKVAYFANEGTAEQLKLKKLILAGVQKVDGDWIYVFHLKDTKSGVQFGSKLTVNSREFLICTNEEIGKSLVEQKDKWLNQKVNVYLVGRDVGLTLFMNVGYVTKIELLNVKGKIIKTLQSKIN